jgi:hypothetical protein
MESFVYTELLDKNGKAIEGSGRLTLCNGYGGFISSIVQDAAIVGGAALIGQGIGKSGSRISNNSTSGAGASAVSNVKQTENETYPSSPTHYPVDHQHSFPVLPDKSVEHYYHHN